LEEEVEIKDIFDDLATGLMKPKRISALKN
jgi:hypothetical protein